VCTLAAPAVLVSHIADHVDKLTSWKGSQVLYDVIHYSSHTRFCNLLDRLGISQESDVIVCHICHMQSTLEGIISRSKCVQQSCTPEVQRKCPPPVQLHLGYHTVDMPSKKLIHKHAACVHVAGKPCVLPQSQLLSDFLPSITRGGRLHSSSSLRDALHAPCPFRNSNLVNAHQERQRDNTLAC